MEIQLNEELINRCNNQSMYNRGTHIQEAARDDFNSFDVIVKDIEKQIGTFNSEQLKLIEKRKSSFKDFIEQSYNEYLSIASNFVPINVAGPAKYDTNKYNKISDRMDNKINEIQTKINNFFDNTKKMLKDQIPTEELIDKYRHGFDDPISSDDPRALDKLNAKLEFLQEKHQMYLDFNKKARKNNEQTLAPYVLTNSNQNIKSVKNRISQLEKMNNLKLDNYYFENGEVCFDKNDNRVRIYFDEIPSEDIRKELKSHAFKWSPTNQAWQRKLTPDAIYMTKRMFKDIGSLEIKLVQNNLEDKSMTM